MVERKRSANFAATQHRIANLDKSSAEANGI
jgi:hypothetical protein